MTRHRTLPYLFDLGTLLIGGAVWLSLSVPPPVAQQRKRVHPNKTAHLQEQMRSATAKEQKAALATIRAQLDAFRRNDYATAAKFQSRNLKKNFSSVAAFRKAIREGYPQFANYKSVAFGPVRVDRRGVTVVVPVTLTGNDKVTVRGVYLLTREGDSYRVTSVLGGTNPRQNPRQETPEEISPGMAA